MRKQKTAAFKEEKVTKERKSHVRKDDPKEGMEV